jgi:hypothetical protein
METLREVVKDLHKFSREVKTLTEDDVRLFEKRIRKVTDMRVENLWRMKFMLMEEFALHEDELYFALWACSKDLSFSALFNAEFDDTNAIHYFKVMVEKGILQRKGVKARIKRINPAAFYVPTTLGRRIVDRAVEILHPEYPERQAARFYRKDMVWVNTYVKSSIKFHDKYYL